ncbi:YqaJ viral recombinase family nuclease [Brevibacterium moorei]|uniref:YqaJ viral recombinase family nuclease n=1 Tax=Brevibacterium moorei TaxID=2968457 RepID=UPI00211BD9BF|nr:YqaJ viral recombinase family protein [Brevibacterium sp. 68QC2CO]MCQ9384383.1 YqaJ viral recombinase family protein [Brevibacterium sp. 68QC2CO]
MALITTTPADMATHCQLVANVKSNTPEWEAERNKSLGCSDMSAVLGLNPWADQHSVWMQKVMGVKTAHTWRFDVGHALEPVVRGIFQEETGLQVDECGMLRSIPNPWLHYSPDGLIGDDALFEAKTTSWHLEDDWADDQVADHAEVQVQAAMAVTGRSRAYVAAMIDGNPDRFHIRVVERDDAFIEDMLTVAEFFWTEYVQKSVEPPLTGASLGWAKETWTRPDPEDIADIGDDGLQLLEDMQAAKQAEKAAAKIAADREAQLRALVGDRGVIMQGDRKLGTLKRVVSHRLDEALMVEDGLDPAKYKKESAYTRFFWAAKKKTA